MTLGEQMHIEWDNSSSISHPDDRMNDIPTKSEGRRSSQGCD